MTKPTTTPAQALDPLAAGFDTGDRTKWLALVDKAIKGAEFEKKMVSKTLDGLRIDPLYTRTDALPGTDRSAPGHAPFVRGGAGALERGGWDIRQFHSGNDAKAINEAILEDLAGGASSIALHIGIPGAALALGENALDTALDGVMLDICPIALIAGEATPEAASELEALWASRGIANETRRGHYGADPLGALAMSGSLAEPLEDALTRSAQLAARTQSMPNVTALIADGHAYHCGGASEAQELAVMLATFVAYMRACETAGITPDKAVPKIAVALAAVADQFLTIAKLRAARRLVWRVADAAGAGDAAGKVQLTAVTAWRMMAKRDPWTNILRTTIACASGALGGADAITVLPFTYALGKPDAFARRVARNIQIVCKEESNLGRVADPAGGSWFIEKMTDDLAKAAWGLFQEIEGKGGMAKALLAGFVQDKIAETAAARAKAIATGRSELTGVSAFPILGDDGVSAEPFPAQTSKPDARPVTAPSLTLARLGEPFEALRDAADVHEAATGQHYEVFLASIGAVIDHNIRSTWIKNYLAAGGIAATMSDGYASAIEAATAFRASGLSAACICSSDALNAEHAEATAKALKAAGAKLVLMAGRPGDKDAALKAAGVDQFLFAGADAVATLAALQQRL